MFENTAYYHNFSVDSPTLSLTVIMWALCIGLAVGAVVFTFSKHRASKLIEKLTAHECNCPNAAKALGELQIKPSRALASRLRDDEPLRKYVKIANADECRVEEYKNTFLNKVYRFFRKEDIPATYDLKKAMLYIPDDVKHTAQTRYESQGSPIISSIIVCVLFAIVAMGLTYFMPMLLELLDSAITAYKQL